MSSIKVSPLTVRFLSFSNISRAKMSFLGLIIMVGLIFLNGCVNFTLKDTRGESASPLEEESYAEFMDVPYPSTMSLERKNTYTYTRKGIQAGVVSVVGNLTTDEIGAYYDARLPDLGWEPRAEAQSGKLISTWVKGQRVLTIIASPITLSLGSNLRLELWVAPPHTKGDLGQRVVYESSAPSGETIIETKPIRGGKQGSFSEEDI